VQAPSHKASVGEVAAAIVVCNPVAAADDGLTVDWLRCVARVLTCADNMGILVLPPSIGDLTVTGALHLNENILESLLESFGSLTVGGGLNLCSNQLESLPELFGSLTVGGDLFLNRNKLESLPESFGTMMMAYLPFFWWCW